MPSCCYRLRFSGRRVWFVSICNIWDPFCRVTVTDRDAGSACGVDDWMPLNILDADRLSVGKWVINSLVMGVFASAFGIALAVCLVMSGALVCSAIFGKERAIQALTPLAVLEAQQNHK